MSATTGRRTRLVERGTRPALPRDTPVGCRRDRRFKQSAGAGTRQVDHLGRPRPRTNHRRRHLRRGPGAPHQPRPAEHRPDPACHPQPVPVPRADPVRRVRPQDAGPALARQRLLPVPGPQLPPRSRLHISPFSIASGLSAVGRTTIAPLALPPAATQHRHLRALRHPNQHPPILPTSPQPGPHNSCDEFGTLHGHFRPTPLLVSWAVGVWRVPSMHTTRNGSVVVLPLVGATDHEPGDVDGVEGHVVAGRRVGSVAVAAGFVVEHQVATTSDHALVVVGSPPAMSPALAARRS